MSGTQLFCLIVVAILVTGSVLIAWADAYSARTKKKRARPPEDQPWRDKQQ